jgi:hypothetical protein
MNKLTLVCVSIFHVISSTEICMHFSSSSVKMRTSAEEYKCWSSSLCNFLQRYFAPKHTMFFGYRRNSIIRELWALSEIQVGLFHQQNDTSSKTQHEKKWSQCLFTWRVMFYFRYSCLQRCDGYCCVSLPLPFVPEAGLKSNCLIFHVWVYHWLGHLWLTGLSVELYFEIRDASWSERRDGIFETIVTKS